MSLCTIRFQVTCQTKLGEVVYICGNTPQLGNWTPQNAMRLYTDSALYPKWDPYKSILIRQGNKLLFKLCIVDQNQNIRWQSIPHNREIIATQNLLIQFTAHFEQITITPIIEQIAKPPRKKTCDILNQLQSDGSSSHQYWKQFMSEQQQQSILYITLMTQMRRIIQYGTQQQYINYQQQKLSSFGGNNNNSSSKQFDHVLKTKIEKVKEIIMNTSHLYCIVVGDGDGGVRVEGVQQQGQGRSKQMQGQTENARNGQEQKQGSKSQNTSKDELISVLGQDSYIVSMSQFMHSYSIHNNKVPIIFHIQTAPQHINNNTCSRNNNNINKSQTATTQQHNQNIQQHQQPQTLAQILQSITKLTQAENKLMQQKSTKLQYYITVNLREQPNVEMVKLMIKKKVGLVIVQEQRVLQKLLDLLVQMGRRYDSVGDDVIVVELGLMGVMVVKVEVGSCDGNGRSFYSSNKNTHNGINNNNNNDNKNHQLQTNTYLTKIKKTLLNQSNKSYLHLGKQHFIESLKDDDMFLGLGYHKKNVLLINAQTLDSLSPKILTQIIALSAKPNFEIIILLNKLNTDIKAKFPASKTNKLVVIGKNGLLYANENVLIDLISNLSLQKGKFCQYITKLTNSITMGIESKSQPTTSMIQSQLVFKSTSLGKLGLAHVMNKLKEHNQNFSHYKLVLEKASINSNNVVNSNSNQSNYTIKPYIFTEQFQLRAIFENISKQVHDQMAFIITVNFKNDNNYVHKLCNVFEKVFKAKYNVKLRNMQVIQKNQSQYSFIAREEIVTRDEVEAELEFLCEHFLGSSGIKSYNLNMLSPQQKHRRSFADKQLKQRHFDYSHDKLL